MTVPDSCEVQRADDGSYAVFSRCGTYRYYLERPLGDGDGTATFVMLNPSTADAFKDDPTVARCRRRAASWGCSSFAVVNAFALRSTDPKGLGLVNDPVGPENDAYVAAATGSGIVVVGWGDVMKRYPARETRLRELLVTARCLGTTASGFPRHPLYVPYSVGLEPYDWSRRPGCAVVDVHQ